MDPRGGSCLIAFKFSRQATINICYYQPEKNKGKQWRTSRKKRHIETKHKVKVFENSQENADKTQKNKTIVSINRNNVPRFIESSQAFDFTLDVFFVLTTRPQSLL